jgi:hypothetical protein
MQDQNDILDIRRPLILSASHAQELPVLPKKTAALAVDYAALPPAASSSAHTWPDQSYTRS